METMESRRACMPDRAKGDGSLFGRYRACIEKMAKDDIRDPLEKNKEQQRYIPFLNFIGDTEHSIVLDIGSAQGDFTKKIKGKKIAFDLSLNYLNLAHKDGLLTVAGDAASLPFLDSTIDVVVCSDVLEHVLYPEEVVSQIYRVLSPGGRLFLVVPWEENLSKYEIYEGIYEFTHLRTFNDQIVKSLLREFKLIRKKGIIPNPLPFSADKSFYRFIYKVYYYLPQSIKIKLFGPVHMMIEAVPKKKEMC